MGSWSMSKKFKFILIGIVILLIVGFVVFLNFNLDSENSDTVSENQKNTVENTNPQSTVEGANPESAEELQEMIEGSLREKISSKN